jgi:hypothetical protein
MNRQLEGEADGKEIESAEVSEIDEWFTTYIEA